MALKLITAPSLLPVSLAEAKAHLRITDDVEDTLITAFLHTAVAGAEHETGRALMPQTWEVTLDAFPDAVELTRTPVQSIESVTYANADGTATVLSNVFYALDAADEFGWAYVVPAYDGAWPETRDEINAVRVRYVAGYASAEEVPAAIKSWILLQVGALYENRESEAVKLGRGSALKMGFVDALLSRYKVWS